MWARVCAGYLLRAAFAEQVAGKVPDPSEDGAIADGAAVLRLLDE